MAIPCPPNQAQASKSADEVEKGQTLEPANNVRKSLVRKLEDEDEGPAPKLEGGVEETSTFTLAEIEANPTLQYAMKVNKKYQAVAKSELRDETRAGSSKRRLSPDDGALRQEGDSDEQSLHHSKRFKGGIGSKRPPGTYAALNMAESDEYILKRTEVMPALDEIRRLMALLYHSVGRDELPELIALEVIRLLGIDWRGFWCKDIGEILDHTDDLKSVLKGIEGADPLELGFPIFEDPEEIEDREPEQTEGQASVTKDVGNKGKGGKEKSATGTPMAALADDQIVIRRSDYQPAFDAIQNLMALMHYSYSSGPLHAGVAFEVWRLLGMPHHATSAWDHDIQKMINNNQLLDVLTRLSGAKPVNFGAKDFAGPGLPDGEPSGKN